MCAFEAVEKAGVSVSPDVTGLASFRAIHAFLVCEIQARRFASRKDGRFCTSDVKTSAETLLDRIKERLEQRDGWLESNVDEAAEILATCVAVADYYDTLAAPRHRWLFTETQIFFHALSTEATKIPIDLYPAYFQLALIHLEMDYRRRSTDHLELQQKFAHLEPAVIRLRHNGTARACRLLRRYYHLRSHIVRQVPDRSQAERFLDLASSYADIEQRLTSDPTSATQVLTEKIVLIGLTRVWLLISNGHYHRGLELLALIHAELSTFDGDPIFYGKYLVAKNICLRALAGRDPVQLRQVILGLTEALAIFGDLEDRRHLLRCYYERSMCFLLLRDAERLGADIQFMDRYAHAGGENRRVGWQIQSNILRSRLDCQQADYPQAEVNAVKAMALAAGERLDLLTIEAKNTLAMVLFRQGKLAEAENQLSEALRLNHEELHQTDHGDLSQPALYGVSLLYLARVALLKEDLTSSVAMLHKWRSISARVEHQWVKNLAAEVEQQALHRCLIHNADALTGDNSFEGHLRLLRKTMIERSSRRLRTKKIIDIAKDLGVKRQTVHNWLKDLKRQGIEVSL